MKVKFCPWRLFCFCLGQKLHELSQLLIFRLGRRESFNELFYWPLPRSIPPPAISPSIFPIIQRKTPWGHEACIPTTLIITSNQLQMAANWFCLQMSHFFFWNCCSFSARHFLDDVSSGIRPQPTVKPLPVFFLTPGAHEKIISIFTIRGCTVNQ